VVAIDSAVPRREEGTRTDDDVSTSSMVSLSRGLPSVPSIPSMPSPSHLCPAHLAGSTGSGGGFSDARELPSTAAFEVHLALPCPALPCSCTLAPCSGPEGRILWDHTAFTLASGTLSDLVRQQRLPLKASERACSKSWTSTRRRT
jgi:hypothetical protein